MNSAKEKWKELKLNSIEIARRQAKSGIDDAAPSWKYASAMTIPEKLSNLSIQTNAQK